MSATTKGTGAVPAQGPNLHASHLLTGSMTLTQALVDDDNILARLPRSEQKAAFWKSIAARKSDIEAAIRHQLGVDWCHMCVMDAWNSGSFNVAIPVLLRSQGAVFLRIPLPYRVGEDYVPGNAEEKLRTEIATYAWLEANCPDIPIPTLHAFGLPGGATFTHPSNTHWLRRAAWSLRRWMLWLIGRPVPSSYVPCKITNPLDVGYLLLSQAKGKVLTVSWNKHRHDKAFRERLFRSLVAISVSMNKMPLPRIGSLRFDSDGCITLSNRPLNLHFQLYESEGIPLAIPRDRTYTTAEPFILDLLSFQDKKLLHQPNAIHDQDDGERQLAALAALRATMHHFVRPELRDGPFYLTLTDVHQGNIFVDEDWNIQAVIDLEWAHSLPAEMQLPPYWLTSRAVDGFHDAKATAEYESALDEYLEIYEAEEMRWFGELRQGPVQRHVWRTGAFWYFAAVSVPKGMYNIFNRHVQPLFNEDHADQGIFDEVFFWYWGLGAQSVIDAKLKDKERYLDRVREVFTAPDDPVETGTPK